jgi:predicted Zn finger-like uncharacterized protein
MIAACPKCQTRYRVEPGKLGADGARLRCSQCSAVFRVRLPAEQSAPVSDPATLVGKALASDTAALGGVARSEPQASEAHKAAAPPSNQTRSAEGRYGPEDRGTQPKDIRSTADIPEPPDAAPQFDHSRLVLLAHPNPDACKRVAEALEREGLEVLVAHDGVEAILTVQRALPRAVVLDAALPKMFGFQVCELIKRNESLRVMQVCLIGAIHREDRYRRAPSEIYGADHYIESPSLPGALIEWLGRIGFELRSRTSSPAPAPAPTPAPIEAPRSQVTSGGKDLASDAAVLGGVARSAAKSSEPSEAPASGVRAARSEPKASGDHERAVQSPITQTGSAEGRSGPIQQKPTPEAIPTSSQAKPIGRIAVPADPLAAERAQAERLARIIVSDIVLYNEEKFSAAIRSGGVLETMRDELAEGRALFRERIDVQVRDERDYLADELMRVARSRGAS